MGHQSAWEKSRAHQATARPIQVQNAGSNVGSPQILAGWNFSTGLSATLSSDGKTLTIITTGAPPTGAAGGDLSGFYPNPNVAQWQGVPIGAATLANGSLMVGDALIANAWVSRIITGDWTLSRLGVATIKSSLALAGAPTAATAAALTNTTQLATTAFVNTETAAIGQYFAPATGATVSPTAPQMFSRVFINPAAGIATLTLTLPTGTIQGQEISATFTQAVTTLTVTATNIGTHGIASPAAATATSCFAWAWDNTATKWNRFL